MGGLSLDSLVLHIVRVGCRNLLGILVAYRGGSLNPGALHLRPCYQRIEEELRRRALGPWDGCLAPNLVGSVVRGAPYPAMRMGLFTCVIPLPLLDSPLDKVSWKLMVNQSATCQVASDLSCLLSAGGALKWGVGQLAEGIRFGDVLITNLPSLTQMIRQLTTAVVAPLGEQTQPSPSIRARWGRAKLGRSCHSSVALQTPEGRKARNAHFSLFANVKGRLIQGNARKSISDIALHRGASQRSPRDPRRLKVAVTCTHGHRNGISSASG